MNDENGKTNTIREQGKNVQSEKTDPEGAKNAAQKGKPRWADANTYTWVIIFAVLLLCAMVFTGLLRERGNTAHAAREPALPCRIVLETDTGTVTVETRYLDMEWDADGTLVIRNSVRFTVDGRTVDGRNITFSLEDGTAGMHLRTRRT